MRMASVHADRHICALPYSARHSEADSRVATKDDGLSESTLMNTRLVAMPSVSTRIFTILFSFFNPISENSCCLFLEHAQLAFTVDRLVAMPSCTSCHAIHAVIALYLFDR
jgi:hypothetical protein